MARKSRNLRHYRRYESGRWPKPSVAATKVGARAIHARRSSMPRRHHLHEAIHEACAGEIRLITWSATRTPRLWRQTTHSQIIPRSMRPGPVFRSMLRYKAMRLEARYVAVDVDVRSSVTCSACGARSGPKVSHRSANETMALRLLRCSTCSRDTNAAVDPVVGAERRPLVAGNHSPLGGGEGVNAVLLPRPRLEITEEATRPPVRDCDGRRTAGSCG